MKPITHPASLWPDLAKGLALALMLCGVWPQIAHAQYKWVGRDGVTHYSDLPPPAGARLLPRSGLSEAASGASAPTGTARVSGRSVNSALPAAPSALPSELAALARKAPVVLYTTAGCAPCEEGRSLLRTRGIPMLERRIEQATDQRAMQDLGLPATGFPVLTVGQERVIGFEPGQWQRVLDAAQYPSTSILPRGWQPEPATPLSQGAGTPIHRAAGSTVGARNPDDAVAPAAAADASVMTPPAMAPPGLTPQSAPSQSGSSRIRF